MMNPELGEQLNSARGNYAASKHDARDAMVPTTDHRSNLLRVIYKTAKDIFIQRVAIRHADQQAEAYEPIYRRELAETVAGLQTEVIESPR